MPALFPPSALRDGVTHSSRLPFTDADMNHIKQVNFPYILVQYHDGDGVYYLLSWHDGVLGHHVGNPSPVDPQCVRAAGVIEQDLGFNIVDSNI